MLETTLEKAQELGRLIGQTDEHQALQRARQRVGEDRELVELLNGVAELEQKVSQALQSGEVPEESMREEYEQKISTLQANPVYQSLVAAQSNFEKVLARVNEAIGQGMEKAGQSKIILPS